MKTADLRSTWDLYTSAWNETAKDAKAAALAASAHADCVYRDPTHKVDGHAALLEHMLDFHRDVPNGRFDTTHFEAHHGRSLARWNLLDASGKMVGDGSSFCEYDAQGKLVTMTGFFPVAPPPAS